jgi:hypothetical protein
MILIGLTGRAGAGKSTVAQYLIAHHGFTELAFATPLKQGLALMLRELGVSLDDFEDPTRKERPLAALDSITPRRLMQTLGTEWGRTLVHPSLWCLIMARRLHASTYTSQRIVITDVRFDNEARIVRGRRGHVWAIVRPSKDTAARHASEAGTALIDTGLLNDGTVADLQAQADQALQRLIDSTWTQR